MHLLPRQDDPPSLARYDQSRTGRPTDPDMANKTRRWTRCCQNFARALKRQCNQITESTRRHWILARKKPIVGSETDIGDTFHRVGDQECPETARRRCRYRLLEKDPGVSTVSGSRPLNGNRNFVTLAGLPKSEDISSPFPFVEIRGQEPTGIVR